MKFSNFMKIISILLIILIFTSGSSKEGFTDGFRKFVNPKYKYVKNKAGDFFAYFGIY